MDSEGLVGVREKDMNHDGRWEEINGGKVKGVSERIQGLSICVPSP